MSDIEPPRPIIGFEHGPDVRPLRALIELYAHTSPSLRGQFFTVLGLMLLNTLAELATIGAVIPFLALLADPGSLSNYRWIAGIFAAFGLEDDRQRLILAAASFGCFACIAGIMRLLLNRKTYAFTFDLLHALQRRVFGRLLIQPYEFHIQNGTPTLIAAVDKFEVIIFEVLLPIMLALSAALIATAIVAALVFIDPVMTVIAAACLSVIYIGISALAQPPLARNSRIIANGYDERLKIMQDGFGGIRDVIIDGNHALYDRLYDQSNGSLSEARASTAFIASAPRHAVETLGILLLIGLAMFSVDRAGGLAAALPALGALALGAQRLLPLTQQIYSSWSTVSGNRSVLSQTVRAMRLPERQTDLEAHHAIAPQTGIVLNGVTFRYPSRNTPAIENVGLTISAGSSVALIGKTGSGKSTLADLIMGLLTPSAGQIEIDGVALDERRRRNWQNSIAHVPQSVFLADTTIARNIALSGGDRPLDHERLAGASRQAQLDEFIALLPDGLETVIGERGIRLSGGQRQRLGIARALYKDTPILVLDEATSALDEETEARVMKALAEPGQSRRTTIVIAHRLSTIAHCHTIVRLKGGRIEQIGDPAEVLGKGVSR